LGGLAGAVTGFTGLGAQPETIALTNLTVIDGTGAGPGLTVVMSGDLITAIGRSDRLRVPPGAAVVDGTNKVLIPGLWDMHVHLGTYADGTRALARLIGYGVTGVRDMASPLDDILRLRRETADGSLMGPEIIAAGPILQAPLPFQLPPMARTVTDVAAKETVGELKSKGASAASSTSAAPSFAGSSSGAHRRSTN
jgi:hypothetical protein